MVAGRAGIYPQRRRRSPQARHPRSDRRACEIRPRQNRAGKIIQPFSVVTTDIKLGKLALPADPLSQRAPEKFMQLPVNITYRGVEKSDDIDQFVMDKATRLEKFCDHINRCDVAIEQPNHAHQKGNPFRVRIDVTVPPGHELVSEEKGVDNGSYAPLTKVIHDAFKTMERELRRVVEKQRHEVKTHADSRSPK